MVKVKYPPITSTIYHNPRPQIMSTSPSLGPFPYLEPPPATNTVAKRGEDVSQYPQFMLLGDSITQFGTLTWQAKLQTTYIRRMDVVNRGYSGFTSVMGYRALETLLPKHNDHLPQPDIPIITLFFGANDACVPGQSQHVDLQDYVNTLKKFIDYPAFRRGSDGTQIIIITPSPVNELQTGSMTRDEYQRRAGITSQYALAAAEVAKAQGAHVLDFWTILMRKVGWNESMGRNCCCDAIPYHPSATPNLRSSSVQHIPGCHHFLTHVPTAPHRLSDFLTDGLHLTEAGYNVLFSELMKLIRREIQECAPENLPFVVPEWKEALELSEYRGLSG